MKRMWRWVLTVGVAVVLLLGGTIGAQAADEANFGSEILFEQTGFDPATGVLTMTLRYRVGDGNRDGVRDGLWGGMFAFQIDTDRLLPLKRAENGNGAYGGGAYNRLDNYAQHKFDFLGSTIQTENVYYEAAKAGVANCGGSVTLNMDCKANLDMTSGYGVSMERTGPESTMADCYFHFGIMGGRAMPDADGYVTIVDFKFLLIDGYDDNGNLMIAKDTSQLNARSIVAVPAAEEDQFIANTKFGDHNLAYSAGAYISSYTPADSFIITNLYAFSVSDKIPPYMESWPVDDERLTTQQDPDGTTYEVQTIPAVKLSFDNDNKYYTVLGMDLTTANTFDSPEADFPTPPGLVSSILRYTIPTADQTIDSSTPPYNFTDEANSGVPQKNVDLKYDIRTIVSGSSIRYPEDDAAGFLANLKWVFSDSTGTPLTQLAAGTEFVDEATGITYGRTPGGYLVQFGDDGEAYPVGVSLTYRDSTLKLPNTQPDTDPDDITTTTGRAPQLVLNSNAANLNSCIWETGNYWGDMYLCAVYEDVSSSGGGVVNKIYSTPLRVQLFRQDAVVTSVKLNPSEVGSITTPDGPRAGFAVGAGLDDKRTDSVMRKEISMNASVYDQYGLPLNDRQASFEISPVDGGAENYFVMTSDQKSATKSYIEYGPGRKPNGVTPGYYNVTATVEGVPSEAAQIYINRPEDVLTSLRVTFSTGMTFYIEGNETPAAIDSYPCRIPIRKWNSDRTELLVQKENYSVSMEGINNQYAIYESQGLADVDGIVRNETTGKIDLSSSTGVDIRYRLEDVNGKVLQSEDWPAGVTLDAESGKLVVDSTAKPFEIVYTVSVTYKDVTLYAKTRYNFTRETSHLERITLPYTEFYVPETMKSPNKYYIRAEAYDQYDERMEWMDVYAANQNKYTLKLDLLSALPSGITQSGIMSQEGVNQDGFQFTVTNHAPGLSKEDGIFVRAVYSGVYSQPMRIPAFKNWSKLTNISPIIYNNSGDVKAPPLGSPDTVINPSFTLWDQYDGQLDPNDFTIIWEINQNGANKTTADPNYYELDPQTGEIRIKAGSPEGSIYLRATFIPKSVPAGEESYRKSSNVFLAALITRYSPVISSAEITSTEINYPVPSVDPNNVKLGIRVQSQYGEAEEINTGTTSMRWGIVSVITRSGQEIKAPDPDGVTALSGAQVNSLGEISFSGNDNRDNVAEYIRVRVLIDSRVEAFQTIRVYMKDAVPNSIYLHTITYLDYISVPEVGAGENSRLLSGLVRDQYGLTIPNATIEWSLSGNFNGVRQDGNRVYVDYTASNCLIPLTASYTYQDPTSGRSITIRNTGRSIRISKGEPIPTRAVVNGITDSTGTEALGDTVQLPTPADGSVKYQLKATIYDQFDIEMPEETIRWSLVKTNPAGANITVDQNTGVVTITYSNALRDMPDGRSSFEVKAFAARKTDADSPDTPVYIQKGADIPTYAVVDTNFVMKEGQENRKQGDDTVTVPGRGEENTFLTVTANVYSQYQIKMPDEAVDWTIKNGDGVLKLENIPDSNSAIVEVPSAVLGNRGILQAYPVSAPDKTQNMGSTKKSVLYIYYQKGARYPFETAFGEENPDTLVLPRWEPGGDYIPDLETKMTSEYTLKARVMDQYGVQLHLTTQLIYTDWKLKEDYEGVSIAVGTPQQTEGWVEVTVTISHDSLPQYVDGTEEIVLVTGVVGEPNPADAVRQEVHLKLQKEDVAPSYIYWDGVDEDGWCVENMPVPEKKDISSTRTFTAKTYDEYGYVIQDAPLEWYFNKSFLSMSDTEVRRIYSDPAVTTGVPERSDLYYDGVLIASLETMSGDLTLYYTINTGWLALDAVCPTNGSVVKTGRLELTKDPLVATEVMIRRDPEAVVEAEEGYMVSRAEEPLSEDITATILDQYGRVIESIPDVHMDWSLWFYDEISGEITPYVEYEGDGKTPLDPSEYFLSIGPADGSDRVGRLQLIPEYFSEGGKVYIRGTVVDADGNPIDTTTDPNGPYDQFLLTFTLMASYPRSYYVTYDAGEHGSLDGESMEEVAFRKSPIAIPEIVADKGYEFLGWTQDGETIVDPAEARITRDTTFTALYEAVDDKDPQSAGPEPFLVGYSDGNIYPDQVTTYPEFIKMLVVGFGLYDKEVDYGAFGGEAESAWYDSYMACAETVGILTESEKEQFAPDAGISRAGAALLIYRALGLEDTGTTNQFTDLPEGHWANKYVNALYEAGIVNGCGDGSYYDPDRGVTRAELSKMIVCARGDFNPQHPETAAQIAETDIQLPDVTPDYWAYGYILAAMGVVE